MAKMLILIEKGLKIMWGKMKILLTSLFSFPHNVLKSYIVMVVYFQDCMEKGYDLRQSLNMYREPSIELSQVTFRWCNLF